MCLFSTGPKWEEDVVFANRPSKRRSSRVEETVVRRSSSRPAQYVQAPRASTPIIRPASPPRPRSVRAPSPPPAPAPPRIELVEVDEERERRSSPRGSRASVSVSNAPTRKSKRGSRGGEEVYIERERVRERIDPGPERSSVEMVPAYRYVEGAGPPRAMEEEGMRRSRSITYETNPRVSARTVERERVVVEDGGRRREYYRRP